jgi:DNA-binding FrmR family transcriptional regulator
MKYDDDMKKRLRRVEGQVRGILRMMEEDKDCRDVVTQLSAIRSAVDKTMALVVAVNLERCLLEEQEAGRDTGNLVKEAVELLVKSR